MPKPQPGEGEILIRLHAAGVNPMDWKARDGSFQQWLPAEFPAVLGFDGAGVVEQVGPGVSAFRPGDGVFGQFMARVLHWGTYADYVVTSASGAVVPKPVSLDYVQAAAVPMPAQTALASLDALSIGSGETLLIVGATGGVGTYAIQMAALRAQRLLTSLAAWVPHRRSTIPRATWSAPSARSTQQASMPCWMWPPEIRRALSTSARSYGPVAGSSRPS
jgi:NADPH:quinone reductase-like Zn-dependent oxidoreductase